MSAPFDPQQQAPDPSQIFTDPSQVQALQGGGEPGEPQEPQAQPGQPAPPEHGEALDVETDILEAIEAGCRLAIASTDISAEDFMRFSQGVQFLTAGLKNLQPQPAPVDPLGAAMIGADQRHAAAVMQHAAQVHATETAAAQPPPAPPQAPPAGRPAAQ